MSTQWTSLCLTPPSTPNLKPSLVCLRFTAAYSILVRVKSSSPKNRTISSSTKSSFLSSYSSPWIVYFPQNVPYFECSVENLCSLHANTLHVPLNGLLFLEFLFLLLFPLTSSRFGKMEEGCTPLQLLWKDAQTATYVINTDAQGTILASQSVTVSKPAVSENSYSTKTVRFARWRASSSSRASWPRLTTIRFFAALWGAFARIRSGSSGNWWM